MLIMKTGNKGKQGRDCSNSMRSWLARGRCRTRVKTIGQLSHFYFEATSAKNEKRTMMCN